MQADALFKAMKERDVAKVQKMVESDPGIAKTTGKDGVSCVLYALYAGLPQLAELLAKAKGTLDLFEASSLGRTERVRELLKRDPTIPNSFAPDGYPALALAAYLGHKEVVELLLEKGALVNTVAKNPTGFTALTGALSNNHTQIAKVLIEKGADINYRYEAGFSPLMLAVENGNMEMTRYLLDRGAEVNARTTQGKTPLSFAIEKGHKEIADLLKARGGV